MGKARDGFGEKWLFRDGRDFEEGIRVGKFREEGRSDVAIEAKKVWERNRWNSE